MTENTTAAAPETKDFATFYAATFSSLCTQLYVHTGSLAEAQDVVQEAFVRAMPRWNQLREYEDPVAWVRKVAWNLATSRFRRTRRMVALTSATSPAEPEPSPDRVALQQAIATLPPQQRRAVVLHYLADVPITDIAAMTGVAEGTVKSWLHRARTALTARLSEAEPADAAADLTGMTELQDAAAPHVSPPGVQRVARTVRQRRAAKAISAGAGVLAALLAVAALLPGGGSGPAPIQTGTPTSETSAAVSPSPPEPTTTIAAGAPCNLHPRPEIVGQDRFSLVLDTETVDITVGLVQTVPPICPEVSVKITWVTYEYQPDGSQRLYASGSFLVGPSQPRSATVRLGAGCHGRRWLLMGDVAPVPNIPAGATDIPAAYVGDTGGAWTKGAFWGGGGSAEGPSCGFLPPSAGASNGTASSPSASAAP